MFSWNKIINALVHTSAVRSYLDERTLTYEPIVKFHASFRSDLRGLLCKLLISNSMPPSRTWSPQPLVFENPRIIPDKSNIFPDQWLNNSQNSLDDGFRPPSQPSSPPFLIYLRFQQVTCSVHEFKVEKGVGIPWKLSISLSYNNTKQYSTDPTRLMTLKCISARI